MNRPQRQVKAVTHFIHEQPKYLKGKYHGHRDCYDRGYNGANPYVNDKDSEDEYELRWNAEDEEFIDDSENTFGDKKDVLLNMYTVFKNEISDNDDNTNEESEEEFEDESEEEFEDESEEESEDESEEEFEDESEEESEDESEEESDEDD